METGKVEARGGEAAANMRGGCSGEVRQWRRDSRHNAWGG
jgi:hypothetical protein